MLHGVAALKVPGNLVEILFVGLRRGVFGQFIRFLGGVFEVFLFLGRLGVLGHLVEFVLGLLSSFGILHHLFELVLGGLLPHGVAALEVFGDLVEILLIRLRCPGGLPWVAFFPSSGLVHRLFDLFALVGFLLLELVGLVLQLLLGLLVFLPVLDALLRLFAFFLVLGVQLFCQLIDVVFVRPFLVVILGRFLAGFLQVLGFLAAQLILGVLFQFVQVLAGFVPGLGIAHETLDIAFALVAEFGIGRIDLAIQFAAPVFAVEFAGLLIVRLTGAALRLAFALGGLVRLALLLVSPSFARVRIARLGSAAFFTRGVHRVGVLRLRPTLSGLRTILRFVLTGNVIGLRLIAGPLIAVLRGRLLFLAGGDILFGLGRAGLRLSLRILFLLRWGLFRACIAFFLRGILLLAGLLALRLVLAVVYSVGRTILGVGFVGQVRRLVAARLGLALFFLRFVDVAVAFFAGRGLFAVRLIRIVFGHGALFVRTLGVRIVFGHGALFAGLGLGSRFGPDVGLFGTLAFGGFGPFGGILDFLIALLLHWVGLFGAAHRIALFLVAGHRLGSSGLIVPGGSGHRHRLDRVLAGHRHRIALFVPAGILRLRRVLTLHGRLFLRTLFLAEFFILSLFVLLLFAVEFVVAIVDLGFVSRRLDRGGHLESLGVRTTDVRAVRGGGVVLRLHPEFHRVARRESEVGVLRDADVGELDEILVIDTRRPGVVLLAQERQAIAVRLAFEVHIGSPQEFHPQGHAVDPVIISGKPFEIEGSVGGEGEFILLREFEPDGRRLIRHRADRDRLGLRGIFRRVGGEAHLGGGVFLDRRHLEPDPGRLIGHADADDRRQAFDHQLGVPHPTVGFGGQRDDAAPDRLDLGVPNVTGGSRFPSQVSGIIVGDIESPKQRFGIGDGEPKSLGIAVLVPFGRGEPDAVTRFFFKGNDELDRIGLALDDLALDTAGLSVDLQITRADIAVGVRDESGEGAVRGDQVRVVGLFRGPAQVGRVLVGNVESGEFRDDFARDRVGGSLRIAGHDLVLEPHANLPGGDRQFELSLVRLGNVERPFFERVGVLRVVPEPQSHRFVGVRLRDSAPDPHLESHVLIVEHGDIAVRRFIQQDRCARRRQEGNDHIANRQHGGDDADPHQGLVLDRLVEVEPLEVAGGFLSQGRSDGRGNFFVVLQVDPVHQRVLGRLDAQFQFAGGVVRVDLAPGGPKNGPVKITAGQRPPEAPDQPAKLWRRLVCPVDELHQQQEKQRGDHHDQACREKVEQADPSAGGLDLPVDEFLNFGRIRSLLGVKQGGHVGGLRSGCKFGRADLVQL